MPAQGIHHVDLAVTDVERSLAFYFELLGPFGLVEEGRYATYRGTEEVVYLQFGAGLFALRPADGGEYRYYEPGIEHIAFYVDTRAEVDEAYQRCLAMNAKVHFPPSRTATCRITTSSSSSIRTGSGSRSHASSPPAVGAGANRNSRYFEYLDRRGSLVSRLCRSGVRSWVAFGEHDEVGLTDEERRGLEACPSVTMATIPDSGHMMLDRAARADGRADRRRGIR